MVLSAERVLLRRWLAAKIKVVIARIQFVLILNLWRILITIP